MLQPNLTVRLCSKNKIVRAHYTRKTRTSVPVSAASMMMHLFWLFSGKIFIRVFIENLLASRRTKVVRIPFVFTFQCCGIFIHIHFAYRIDCHLFHLLSIFRIPVSGCVIVVIGGMRYTQFFFPPFS